MAVFSVGTRTGVPSQILPAMSLYATAAVSPSILEVGISSTVGTITTIALCRIAAQGTVGAGLTEANLSQMSALPACTAFGAHTAGTPTLTDLGYRWTLGPTAGSGVIWTFAPDEIELTPSTANGFGVYSPNGTGQALDIYFKWME
jgi:hypothetical protein